MPPILLIVWDSQKLGEPRNRNLSNFSYNYVSRREPNWKLDNDNLSIHYPLDYARSINMIDLVKQFLLNLHENREIGYQE